MNEKLIQGLLGFGSGMLSGNYGRYGQFGPALGQGLQGFQQATNDYTQNALRQKQLEQMEAYQKAQMGHLQTQDKLAQDRAAREQEQESRWNQFMGQFSPKPQQTANLPPINPGNPVINTSPVLPSFGNFAEASLLGQGLTRDLSPGKEKQPIPSPVDPMQAFLKDPVALRKAAFQLSGDPRSKMFLELAQQIETEQNRDRDRNEKTFTDPQGITRYLKSGLPVADQKPKAPEGMRYNDQGGLEEIPGYKAMKKEIAAASASNISFGAPVAGVNPATGEPVFFQADKAGGKPSIVKGVVPPEKANSTEGEKLAAGFHDRMISAEKNMSEVGDKGYPTAGTAVAGSLPYVGKYAERVYMTPEQQRYRQAQEDWVRAKLRKESGATIPDEEMDREIATYFPQVGDGPDVIAQKERSRKTALDAMLRSAGRAKDVEELEGVEVKPYNPVKKPMKGQKVDGYKYIGGDPGKESSWQKE